MGGFLVCPRLAGEALQDVEAKYCRSIEVFAHKGLALDRRLECGGFIVYRYHKLIDSCEQIVEFDNGDFALACGTVFYRGATGTAALRGIYRDYHGGIEALESGLLGAYCVLIGVAGHLTLFGDFCGYYPVYRNADSTVLSNSLIAVGRAQDGCALNKQGFYEFLLNGFVSGNETVLDGIAKLDSRFAWQLAPRTVMTPRRPVFERPGSDAPLETLVEAAAATLSEHFKIYKAAFPRGIGAALSGGYDSRLMLALLRSVGATPYLYVYGAATDSDVSIAKAIGLGEGIQVDHIDKSRLPRLELEDFRAQVQRDLYLFDGIKPLGTLDDGNDVATRLDRANRATLQLNGAGGEIYREIWNLGDRRVGLDKFLRMRFDRANYSFLLPPFDSRAYFARVTEKVRGLLGIERDWIERYEAEMLFPFLRNLFAAPNNATNNQFSPSLVPFMEPSIIYPSFFVPIRYKYCGEMEARIIRRIDPALARYGSAYGIDFTGAVPSAYRFRHLAERHIPMWLRYLKRRLVSPGVASRPYYLAQNYLESVFDLRGLRISSYVDVRRIDDAETLNRAFSVELLLTYL